MGRRGRRKNKNRNNKKRSWGEHARYYHYNSVQQAWQDEVAHEEYRAKHAEYLKKIADIQADIMSRTVFVTRVQNLNVGQNLARLHLFMEERFGAVERCEIAYYSGKQINQRGGAPPGRVRFRHREDAEKVFGKSLQEAARQRVTEEIKCPPEVGYVPQKLRGLRYPLLLIQPTREYNNMVDDDITGTKSVSLNTKELSFGHWFPAGEDAYEAMLGRSDSRGTEQYVWVEGVVTDKMPVLQIDIQKSLVEIDFSTTAATGERGDLALAMLLSGIADAISGKEKEVASFCFKDLVRPMELCKCEAGNLYLLFSLKYPPRLDSKRSDITALREYTTRCTSIAGIAGSIFGANSGYKIRIDQIDLDRLLLNQKALEKLQNYGVLGRDLNTDQYAAPFHQSRLVNQLRPDQVNRRLTEVGVTTRFGLLLRSILDSKSSTWFDMLTDYVTSEDGRNSDIFDLVAAGTPEIVEKVSVPTLISSSNQPANPTSKVTHLHKGFVPHERSPRYNEAPCTHVSDSV